MCNLPFNFLLNMKQKEKDKQYVIQDLFQEKHDQSFSFFIYAHTVGGKFSIKTHPENCNFLEIT